MRARVLRVLLGTVLLFTAFPLDASAWWNSSWTRRRKIFLLNSGQATNLTNFTVVVPLTSARVDYNQTQNLGQDIRFVDADDTTQLNHEIEQWNEAGTSYVWVRVPQVNAASNTDFIYVYYGNPAAADGQNVNGTWDSEFKMVHHLNEPAAGPASHTDSTSNNNHSNQINVQAPQGGAAGQIAGADSFSAAALDDVEVADSPTLDVAATESVTVEAWIRTGTAGTFKEILAKDECCIPTASGWDFMVWSGNEARFSVYDDSIAANATAQGGSVTDNAWHYLVGRWNRATRTAEMFVDGVSVASNTNAALAGSAFSNPRQVRIGEESDSDPEGGFNFNGLLDEVRLSKVVGPPRSNDWIRAQYLSMTNVYLSFAPEVQPCCDLSTAVAADTVTVTAANQFELVFDKFYGGGIQKFYDLAEDPGRTTDLAGGDAVTTGAKTLVHLGLLSGGVWYHTDDNTSNTVDPNGRWSGSGPKLDVLEATSTRVKVRQEAFLQRLCQGGGCANTILGNVKAWGDYTIVPSGRVALRWNRKTNPAPAPAIPLTDQSIEVAAMAECPPLGAACTDLKAYSQSGVVPAAPGNAGGRFDDFMLLQREAVGRKTDFLQIHYPPDWPLADRVEYDNTVAFGTWRDVTVGTIPAGSNDVWNILTYFKPTTFIDHTDTQVTSRSADYVGPDTTTPTTGTGWFDASEKTSSPSDFFNESEGAYLFEINPSAGLAFGVSGSAANPRYNPFFKIRQWRSLFPPSTITFGGSTLARDVDYKADVKPVSRAHFTSTLSWHCTIQDPVVADDCTPTGTADLDVGTSGGANGVTITAGKYGNGAQITANGQYVVAGTTGSLDFNKNIGVVEFWYQPAYASTTATRYLLWQNVSTDNDCYLLEHTAAGALRFAIIVNASTGTCGAGGTTYSVTVPAGAYSWRAGDWVHLRTSWDSASFTKLRVFFNGVQVGSSNLFDPTGINFTGPTYFGGCPAGNCVQGSANANGIIDEPTIYVGTFDMPQPLASGGLVGAVDEFLADSSVSKNYTLNFTGVDPARRGQYLYLGSDSKFRGLNVALTIPGTGVLPGDLDWEYWNGGNWVTMESGFGFTDTTQSFTRSGNLYWNDLTGWSPYSVGGGPDLYYVRTHLLPTTAYTQYPTEGLIKTDILLLQYCSNVVLPAQQFSVSAPIPTAVTLESFSASPANGAVDLSWSTASELQNLGFHLYRAESPGGPFEPITTALIPGLGSSPTGRSYAYRDSGLVNGRTYYYELEDVETTGLTERHGPVSATPAAPSADTRDPQASASGTSYGDPSSVVLREVERSPDHVVLELRTGGFLASPAEDGRVRLRIPGFESASRPGEPHIPMRRAFVEAASGRRVHITSVVASDDLRFPGLRPVPEGVPGIEVSEDGSVSPTEKPSQEGRAFRELFPSESARLVGTPFQGETKKSEVLLFPLRWDGSGLVLSRRLLVRLEFWGSEARETSRGGSRGRRLVERADSAPVGVAARFVVKQRGLQRVSYEDVFGADPASRGGRGVPESSLRLSRQGKSVAFHVEPSGAFGRGSSLYFWSEGPDLNPYGDAVYELETNTTKRSLRMAVEQASSASAPVFEYFPELRFEQNLYYQAGLLAAPDLWLWDVLVSPEARTYPFTVTDLATSPSPGRVEVVLQGASDFDGVTDHHVRVKVNGSVLGETTWDGKLPRTLEVAIPSGVLVEGANAFELEDVGDTGAAYSMVFLNRFAVSYPRRLAATQGSLEGRFESSGQAEILGASPSSPMLDITGVPRWIVGATATPSGALLSVQEGRSYVVASAAARPEVQPVHANDLRSATNRADYLLLAPEAFLGAAQPLLDLRESQGLATKGVSLEAIYEQFGFGEVSPEAIKEFLEYAYHSWAAPSPRYVLLLGDASYDPKNYLGTGVKDVLPGFPVRTSYLWTVSDPAYASVNGGDSLPDLAIGRLPAASVHEAETLVQKVLAFEGLGRSFVGNAVLVADNPDLAGDFEANADDLATSVLAPWNPQRIYYRQMGGATRAAIMDAFDRGAFLVGYVGHGSTMQWASEQIFRRQDVSLLAPQPRQPLVTTMNCLNGFFQFPALNTLSEELVKAEGKGAIAAFSPAGLSVNDPAHVLHKALLEEILSGRHERVGDAVLAAQGRYSDSGAFPELLSIYHLLGDPALRIP